MKRRCEADPPGRSWAHGTEIAWVGQVRISRIVLLLLACWMASTITVRSAVPVGYTTHPQTDGWLTANRPRYERAIQRARSWLAGIDVDPIELRRDGVKGKKKLVELVDAYVRLLQTSENAVERAELRGRLERIAQVTRRSEFHDMAVVDDDVFKQDSTSYLRLAVLLGRVGIDVSEYVQHIEDIQPRLDAHLIRRGSHQRAAFHWYYHELGLAEPFSLSESLEQGLTASRADPGAFDREDAYSLTHEVFVPYEYGERLDVEPFDFADRVYLRNAVRVLTRRYLDQGDADLVAEFVSCARMLRFVDLPEYRAGLGFLLDDQKPDGSWGHYEAARRDIGDLVRVKYELHTTTVAIDALTLAFHRAWNRAIEPADVAGDRPPPADRQRDD